MSLMTCLHCGATTSNGLALCDLCQRAASTYLEFLPVYFRNLARWRPGRAGSRPVPGSRVLYDGSVRGQGTGDRISDKLDEAHTALTTWTRSLVDDRDINETRPLTFGNATLLGDLPESMADDTAITAAGLCAGLRDHVTSIATLEWCGEFVRELAGHEQTLRALTEALVPGWYAGACRRQVSMEGPCGSPTYVVPGITWVTCAACGSMTYARDHLEKVLNEARDWIAPPKGVAEAIVAMLDTEQSVPKLYDRIRQWAKRDQINPIQRTERQHVWSDIEKRLVVADELAGPKRYRLGDVLDLVLTEGQTRGRAASTDVAAEVG